jgi:hypothetical protein
MRWLDDVVRQVWGYAVGRNALRWSAVSSRPLFVAGFVTSAILANRSSPPLARKPAGSGGPTRPAPRRRASQRTRPPSSRLRRRCVRPAREFYARRAPSVGILFGWHPIRDLCENQHNRLSACGPSIRTFP